MNKIDLNVPKQPDQARVNRNKATQTEPVVVPKGASPASEPDQVKVSERAATINRLASQTSELPDVREEKVSELRDRVNSGSYKPSADDIADAILKDEE